MQGQQEAAVAGGYTYDTAPIVSQANAAERSAFIVRTYMHLFGAIIAFAVLETLWFMTPVAGWVLNALGASKFMWLAVLAGFMGVSYVANKWAMSSVSLGKQYAGLGLYTFAESLLFLPLIAMAVMVGAEGEEGILSKAVLITLTLFGSLTGVVFATRKDFSFMRSVLMFAGIAAAGAIVCSIVFGFTLGMIFSYAMVAFACGYILYDTSNVMLHYRTSQHVAASLALFASVMLLFWYVLRIFLNRRD
jgi:FtsH-binding integral membrane protein